MVSRTTTNAAQAKVVAGNNDTEIEVYDSAGFQPCSVEFETIVSNS